MLKEISIMRPVLIVQLVVFHSFIIYGGGWNQPVGFKDIPQYGELAGWTYSFMLEAFTFISGYIFLYTSKMKGLQDLRVLIEKKSWRLLLPMLIFGIAYFYLLEDKGSIVKSVYTILSGAGHLWYLLMLFWCFVWAWILQRLKVELHVALSIILFLAIFCSWMPFPLQIGKSFYYLLFFYYPVLFVEKREVLAEYVLKRSGLVLSVSWGIFVLSFILIRNVHAFPLPYKELPTLQKLIVLSLNNLTQIIYSTLGVIAFYLTALYIAGGAKIIRKDSLIARIGNYCFGVYIFQQFILKFLYFHTPIPAATGPYLLPWVGVMIALLVSYLLTYLIRLTKIGREIL